MSDLQHYRASKLGDCLREALEELSQQGKIEGSAIDMVNECFDRVTNEALAGEGVVAAPGNERLSDWYGKTKVNIKGHLHMFRGVDNVWTLLLTEGGGKKVSIKVEPDDREHLVDGLKIIAMQKGP
mmetsp:Transcript_31931/g.75854  ORF Transcript_31931/g.75854 Transcript_31931/m.75854 type:complete len:126 (+) Transcript_31931:146-523(+)|eukprot:CAMPEP_0180134074 /NCGR_PEP_ID=MMETSP0986-20121125/9930_1 /TAXON_ID=697907 /ORGANISM="non described non described, Strain CCMP2293" /LENGTH=125 /DNA_ID=CAMNT_0022074335 /DNA_START=388 /DNA_END=765 /DNA_ORIENTATION=-